MKHLTTFCRHDVSQTSAITVGSPSVDRRRTVLKPLFLAMLFLIAGIGNAWADETQRFVFSSYSSSTATDDQSNSWSTSGTIASSELPADTTLTTANSRGVGMQAANTTITSSEEFSNVTKVRIDFSYNKTVNAAYQVFVGETQIGGDCSFSAKQVHAKSDFTSATPLSGAIQIKLKTRTQGTIWIGAVTVVTSGSGSGSSNPTLSFAPFLPDPIGSIPILSRAILASFYTLYILRIYPVILESSIFYPFLPYNGF